MNSTKSVLKDLLDAHAGNPQLLAVQVGVSPASVQRWVNGETKPRPAYEAKLRKLHSDISTGSSVVREDEVAYRVTPHHPMITEAVDQTLRSIREILHKRAHLASRSQALDELSKLLFTHVEGLRSGSGGLSQQVFRNGSDSKAGAAVLLKRHVDQTLRENLPKSLAHTVDPREFELRLRPHEDDLALELVGCFETLQRQTSSFNFSGFDILNEVFGKFLADSFIDEKELGQYLTPPEVVRFMVSLAVQSMSKDELQTLCDPDKCPDFGLILDPSCGVASFLAEMVHTLGERMQARLPAREKREQWLRKMLTRVVVGIDKSERMVRLALTNVAMFGLPMARLHLANSLARHGEDGKLTDSLAGKAGLILTNPPFGATFQGNDLVKYRLATQWARKLPAHVDSELLFIERYLDWLAPGGQLVAIVPDSILTNKAVFEDLRRAIAGSVELCSVVSLPSVTFGVAGTSTKTSILHLRKKAERSPRAHATAFAICQDIGFTVATKSNQRTKAVHGPGELPRILDEIGSHPSKPKFVKWMEDVGNCERWDAQCHASLSAEIEQRLAQKAGEDLTVADVADLVDERADPRRWGTQQFSYIEISDIDAKTCAVYANTVETHATPSRARKMVRAGDVLVSTVRPERGAVGVVPAQLDKSICTTGLAVLRPRGIDPLILAMLLKTDFVLAQVMRNNVGIAYPAINEACLLEVLLPIRRSELSGIEKHAKQLADADARLQVLRSSFSATIEDAGAAWRQMSLIPNAKPRSANGTTSRRLSRTSDSDSREPEFFSLAASRKV
ncbi:MAG: N-6 DNA methylase [Chthoniobacteraceae bacterium]